MIRIYIKMVELFDYNSQDEWNLYGAHPVYLNLEEDGKANMVFLKNSHAMGEYN
jgi:hypothetical protein